MVCFQGRSIVHRPKVRVLLELPSAQSPCACARGNLAHRDLLDHVSRRYPAFIARTGSCVSPQPSPCFRSPVGNGSVPVAVSPGWEEDLPDVTLHIFPCVLGPLPRQLVECIYPFLPPRLRPSPREDRVGAQQHPYSDFRTAPFSRLQSFLHVQARRYAHHPGRSYRYGYIRMAAVVSPSEPLVVRDLPTPRICLPSESGN